MHIPVPRTLSPWRRCQWRLPVGEILIKKKSISNGCFALKSRLINVFSDTKISLKFAKRYYIDVYVGGFYPESALLKIVRDKA